MLVARSGTAHVKNLGLRGSEIWRDMLSVNDPLSVHPLTIENESSASRKDEYGS